MFTLEGVHIIVVFTMRGLTVQTIFLQIAFKSMLYTLYLPCYLTLSLIIVCLSFVGKSSFVTHWVRMTRSVVSKKSTLQMTDLYHTELDCFYT